MKRVLQSKRVPGPPRACSSSPRHARTRPQLHEQLTAPCRSSSRVEKCSCSSQTENHTSSSSSSQVENSRTHRNNCAAVTPASVDSSTSGSFVRSALTPGDRPSATDRPAGMTIGDSPLTASSSLPPPPPTSPSTSASELWPAALGPPSSAPTTTVSLKSPLGPALSPLPVRVGVFGSAKCASSVACWASGLATAASSERATPPPPPAPPGASAVFSVMVLSGRLEMSRQSR
jgi:hypothetical protein